MYMHTYITISHSLISLTEVEISISALGYEVDESMGVVRVTVQKSGVFPLIISGSVTTTAGTAGTYMDYCNHSID